MLYPQVRPPPFVPGMSKTTIRSQSVSLHMEPITIRSRGVSDRGVAPSKLFHRDGGPGSLAISSPLYITRVKMVGSSEPLIPNQPSHELGGGPHHLSKCCHAHSLPAPVEPPDAGTIPLGSVASSGEPLTYAYGLAPLPTGSSWMNRITTGL